MYSVVSVSKQKSSFLHDQSLYKTGKTTKDTQLEQIILFLIKLLIRRRPHTLADPVGTISCTSCPDCPELRTPDTQ